MRYYSEGREKIDYFREEYFFLSNFYPAKLIFEGITYHSAKAAFQAQKLADSSARAAFAELSPDEAKRRGKSTPLRPDWEDVKLDVMRKIVYAKFTQNPHLAQWLIDTGKKPLVEGNTWGDVYWGVDLRTGEGENHLGQILSSLREDFSRNGVPQPDAMPASRGRS